MRGGVALQAGAPGTIATMMPKTGREPFCNAFSATMSGLMRSSRLPGPSLNCA